MTTTIERHTHSCQYGTSLTEIGGYVVGMMVRTADDADRMTVEIRCTDYPPGLAENDDLVCYIDGGLVFAGRVARPARAYYSDADATIYGEGNGALMAHNWKADGVDPEVDAAFNRVYSNQEDGDIAQNLAEAAGVPTIKTSIQSSGIVRGTVFDVVLRPGQSFWSLIRGEQGMDEPAGYITFEDNRGVIVRKPHIVEPGSISVTATEGDNILSASRSPRGTESIFNRCIYYGLEYEGATIGGIGVGDYSLSNSNIDGYNPKVIRTNMVETDADALASATQYVNHHNFPYDETNITILGDATATVGQTWQIDSTTLDHAGDSTSLRWAAAITHSYGAGVGFETSAKLTRPTETW